MKYHGKYWFVAAAAVAVAALLRVPALELRPMHHDEANQAVRCAELLRSYQYTYDPADHHGPTLYYFSVPSMRLMAGTDFSATTEGTFRIVPVFFGLLLIVLMVYTAVRLGQSVWRWAESLSGASRQSRLMRGYVTALAASVHFRRFAGDLLQIFVLLIVLGLLLYAHLVVMG